MRFSFIVPIYNAEKYVVKCIDSILSQTYGNFELILVDDGSTDNSGRICDEYSQKDNRVKVIHQKNVGVNKTRKNAAKAAMGEYIVPIDADDWISKDLLAQAYEVIKETNVDIYCYDCLYVWENKQAEYHTWLQSGYYDKDKLNQYVYPSLLRNVYGKRVFPTVWGKIFKRELYKKFQLSTNDIIRIGEDESVCLPCVFFANSIYISHSCHYYYRQNPASATKAKRGFPWTDIPARVEIYRKHLPMDRFGFEAQLNRLIVHELFNVALSHLKTDRPYKEVKAEIIENFNDEFYADAIKNCKYKKNIKEKLATFAVRHRLVFLIKIYAMILNR